MYIKKTYHTQAGRVVEEYHSGRCRPPGEKRREKRKATPEEMRRDNLRIRQRKAKLLLMANFRPGDYHTTLTYRKEVRPADLKECKADLQKFIRKLRGYYRKKGEVLKWICNIECGSKGAFHIHLVVNRIEGTDMMLSEAWIYGRPKNVLIEDERGLIPLSAYISKETETQGGERVLGFSHSRNLKIPRPHVKTIKRWETWKEDVKIPKGYELDKGSYQESSMKPVLWPVSASSGAFSWMMTEDRR